MRWVARIGSGLRVGALACAVTGCPSPGLPAPTVTGVDPSFAFNGEATTLEIVGDHFYPEVAIDAWRGGADVDPGYSAWLTGPIGGVELQHDLIGVGIVDDQHLVATVAAGLPPGLYSLGVEARNGRHAELVASFTVTDSEAAGLTLSAEQVAYPITDLAEVAIDLVDLAGERVGIPFEVALVATSGDGSPVSYGDTTLAGAVPTPDGDGIRGMLVNGTARVSLGLERPGVATVTVSPWDAASPIVDDTLNLQFVPGDDLQVALRLPVPADPEPVFEAGVPLTVIAELVDQYGNPVAFPTSVDLETVCSGWIARDVALDGPTPVEVVPVSVTTDLCSHDKVVVTAGSGPPGASPLFTVRPGPADHFAVIAFATPAPRAGDVMGVYVAPEDQYGNTTTWTSALTLTVSAGGFLAPACEPLAAPLDGAYGCVGTVTVAGPSQTVQVVGDGGVSGTSNPFTVLADEVPTAVSIAVDAVATAGEPVQVVASALDVWGNVIPADDLGTDPFVLVDELGESECTRTGTALSGAATYDCLLFTARPSATFDLTLVDYALAAVSDPIDVANGPLAVVSIGGPATVVAGALATFSLTAEDAYGNPYIVQDDALLDVTDDSGTFSTDDVLLDLDGTATMTGLFTRSGPTVVRVFQFGTAFGASGSVLVLASGTTSLAVMPAAPWAWVGEPLDVTVQAVDPFGNRTDYAGTATLSSTNTGSPPVDVTLVNGVGVRAFTWTGHTFAEVLHAASGSYEGEVSLVVASRCAGPTVDVSFGGYPEAIACTDAADEALVVADLSGSTGAVVGYAIASVGASPGPVVSDTQPVLELPLTGTGRHELRALAVDASGCGSEAPATAWTGPDDGRAVGPVAMSTAAVMPEPGDVFTVDIDGVVDCSRDPAAGVAIELRSTLGALAAAPTGVGLEAVLDATGGDSVDLTLSGPVSEGTLEVHATVDGGSASGLLTVPIVDADSVHPVVTWQSPAGLVVGQVGVVTLGFSEPLLAGSVVASRFLVTGPQITTVTPTYIDGDTVVTLTLTPPVDADLGGYSVEVSQEVRDAHGNRLSGDWTGGIASYLGGFGAAGSPPVAVTCVSTDPAGLVLRPDGDPGLGIEADTLAIAVSSAAAPAWWVVEVRDVGGTLVWEGWDVPVGAEDTVAWSARSFTGYVVPNGVYRVQVWPDDGLGNRGAGCEVSVTIENPIGAVP